MAVSPRDYPILEFSTAEAIIEPSRVIKPIDIPQHCVVCFFQDVIDELRLQGAREIDFRHSEIGKHPIYEIEHDGRRLAFFHPGICAPLGAAILEEVIALGCRKFVACGGAGVLDGSLAVGQIVVPNAAIRDEGTSYHYLPPAREVHPSPAAVEAIESVLQAGGHAYTIGKTWTTDAIYRETREIMELRKAEGCITVEMEAAAFFAVAKFREVLFGQLLYAGDDLSGEWDPRDWNRHSIRQELFWLAASACLKL
jgi:uridine phosphorylase